MAEIGVSNISRRRYERDKFLKANIADLEAEIRKLKREIAKNTEYIDNKISEIEYDFDTRMLDMSDDISVVEDIANDALQCTDDIRCDLDNLQDEVNDMILTGNAE